MAHILDQRSVRIVRRIWNRHRAIFFIILTSGILFVVLGWNAIWHEPQSFFSHIAAGVVAVLYVTFVIERPFASHLQTLNRFRVRRFCREVSLADAKVVILDIWMRWILDAYRRELFRSSALIAARNGVHIRILVADPNGRCAADRAMQLSANAPEFRDVPPEDILQEMERSLDFLRSLEDSICQDLGASRRMRGADLPFEVRVCNEGVKLSMYRVDEMAYWTHYLQDQLSTDGLQYRTTTDIGPAEFLNQHFPDLWNHPGTVPLAVFP